ncbi:hypothetical protein [Thalassomonas sp. RHCl1]|uniref:hypothetical protein n=1 Tax=Thalassomonas sp. RHCl1 TaxID=2995320 RepID=UPI00248BEFFA|nr:hypothetical protein [Thalassomonas sp. RHCl1]
MQQLTIAAQKSSLISVSKQSCFGSTNTSAFFSEPSKNKFFPQNIGVARHNQHQMMLISSAAFNEKSALFYEYLLGFKTPFCLRNVTAFIGENKPEFSLLIKNSDCHAVLVLR